MQAVLGPMDNLLNLALAYGPVMRRIEHAYANPSLGVGEIRLLLEIEHNVTIAAELGRSLAMDSGQVTRVVRNLEKRGLIERVSEGQERSRIQLTQEGQAVCHSIRAKRFEASREIYDEMSQAERFHLMETAKALAFHLDYMDENEIVLCDGVLEDAGRVHSAAVARLQLPMLELDPILVTKELYQLFSKLTSAQLILAKRAGFMAGAAFFECDRRTRTGRVRFVNVDFYKEGRGIFTRLLKECAKRARASSMTSLAIKLPYFEDATLTKLDDRWERAEILTEICCNERIAFAEWHLPIRS